MTKATIFATNPAPHFRPMHLARRAADGLWFSRELDAKGNWTGWEPTLKPVTGDTLANTGRLAALPT
jgi:hypothetical protein